MSFRGFSTRLCQVALPSFCNDSLEGRSSALLDDFNSNQSIKVLVILLLKIEL